MGMLTAGKMNHEDLGTSQFDQCDELKMLDNFRHKVELAPAAAVP